MMKKFGKGLMLLALAASMVFGFVACGGDDDEEEKKDTFTSQTKTVDAKDVNETVTSVNTTVTFNPTGIVTATVDGTRITLTSEKAGTTTMTIKVSGTGYTDEEVKIKVTVAANGEITWEEEEEETPATPATYNFVGLELSDFPTNSLVTVSGSGDETAITELSGDIYVKKGEKVVVKGATLYSKGTKNLRVRADNNTKKTTAINFNGGLNVDLTTASISIEDRYISIPVDGAGTVTATVTFKGLPTTDANAPAQGGPLQAAFVDADGNLLGEVATGAKDGDTDTTVSGTVNASGTAYLVFSRNGTTKSDDKKSGTGGLDVTSIAVTAPAQ